MNVYDSARMADVLAPLGYLSTDNPADADMVVLNTCHIREKAAEKVYSELGRLRRVKEAKAAAGGLRLIAVSGCVASWALTPPTSGAIPRQRSTAGSWPRRGST